jgi:hypothetical protein
MDGGGHEERLEGDLSVREALNFVVAETSVTHNVRKLPFALCIFWFYVIFRA